MPPYRRRRSRRRRFPALPVIVILVAAVALVLVLSGTCGSKVKRSNRRSSATPLANAVTPASVAPGRASVTLPPRVPVTPEAGFTPSPPTPEPTCAPEEMLRAVNKEIALPAEYVPSDLVGVQPIDASPVPALTLKVRREAEDALHRMLEKSREGGLSIIVQSAYRSYPDQLRVYEDEVKTFGQEQADRESARPGHSEHQLGIAVDFSSKRLNFDLNDSFAATAEGKWLAQNASQYGFVLSYPDGKEQVTGYKYEPWHYRYVGTAPALAVKESGLTLNEWLQPRQAGCRAT